MRQYDSSILPSTRDQNAHDTRQCGSCLEDMTGEDIAMDCIEQDCLCDACREHKGENEGIEL